MKIIDKTKRPDIVEFWEIDEAGTCFKIDDSRFDTEDIFMRTSGKILEDHNAIRLVNGSLESLPSDTECILLDSELTVTIKK